MCGCSRKSTGKTGSHYLTYKALYRVAHFVIPQPQVSPPAPRKPVSLRVRTAFRAKPAAVRNQPSFPANRVKRPAFGPPHAETKPATSRSSSQRSPGRRGSQDWLSASARKSQVSSPVFRILRKSLVLSWEQLVCTQHNPPETLM